MTAGKKIINLVFAPVILIAAVAFIVVLVKMKKSPPPRIPEVAVPPLRSKFKTAHDLSGGVTRREQPAAPARPA